MGALEVADDDSETDQRPLSVAITTGLDNSDEQKGE